MFILAVDPGSVHIGWAVLEIATETLIEWGDHDFEKVAYERRFMAIHSQLVQITAKYGEEMESIAVEQSMPFRGKARHSELDVAVAVIYNFGMTRLRGPKRNYRTRKYPPATWKSQVAGSPRAGKEEVARVVRLHYPALPADVSDHVTDAIGIGIHHLGQRKIEEMSRDQ